VRLLRLRLARVSTTTPVVLLMSGVSRSAIEAPIIGPPKRISAASSVSPPQNSSTSRSLRAHRDDQVRGPLTPGPLTVTTRSISGSPVSKISAMQAIEPAFCTTTPTCIGSLPGGHLRPVTALISIFSAPCGYFTVSGRTVMSRSRDGRPERLDRVGLVLLHPDHRAAHAQRVHHDPHAEVHALRELHHRAVVGGQVRLALGAVDQQQLDLHVRGGESLTCAGKAAPPSPTTPRACTASTTCAASALPVRHHPRPGICGE
jgi:hypothetical protein